MSNEHRKAKQREYQARYQLTDKGKATRKRYQDRRIFLGTNDCRGIAATTADAQRINAYIQARKRAFKGQQARAKAKGDPLGTVPSSATP